ncbi:MAG: tRNA (adenosine(37)-N6)-threonylcarbamoyltransferase complex ATPase subunit type 1 TsaE [Patescibacteria group bacterium]|jgi:tRNA threonylcarbamoyladenosine biosynthesis protein TsaE
MKIIITKNEKATFNFGLALGKKCRGGEVFALCGNLGAGKTKLLQGLAAGLRIKKQVNSPTFNILKIYKSAGKVKYFCHIDAYRLRSGQDLIALGVEEFLNSQETVTAIEWAEKVEEIWPKEIRVVSIKQLSINNRAITIN